MPGTKRTEARISGSQRATEQSSRAGQEIVRGRKRRRLTQARLAAAVGISRPWLAAIEAGNGGGAPLEVWFALAAALGRYLRFEFARDPQAELADAGHLAMQELVIRVARAAGWEVQLEAATGAWDSWRSIDVRLTDRSTRQIAVVECWNTFGDLGAAARSSNAKVKDEEQRAVAIAGDGTPFNVGLVWAVRDTRANRDLIGRYGGVFESRFPGSSAAWVRVVEDRTRLPNEPGLIWCDMRATRFFARRCRASSPAGTSPAGVRASQRSSS